MAQSVKRLTSAQVMISQFVGLSPGLGSVQTAQSLEPAPESMSPSLSLLLPTCTLSLPLSKINKHLKNFFKMLIFLRLFVTELPFLLYK